MKSGRRVGNRRVYKQEWYDALCEATSYGGIALSTGATLTKLARFAKGGDANVAIGEMLIPFSAQSAHRFPTCEKGRWQSYPRLASGQCVMQDGPKMAGRSGDDPEMPNRVQIAVAMVSDEEKNSEGVTNAASQN